MSTVILMFVAALATVNTQSQPSPRKERTPHVQILPSTVRWSVPISAVPTTAAVIAADRVLIVLANHVAAFLATNGEEAWRVNLKAAQPLAVADGRAYVAAEDAIHALRLEDGSVAWRSWSGPLTAPLLVHEGWIVASAADRLATLRATDGSIVWQSSATGQTERATIDGDVLYVPHGDGRVVAYDLPTGTLRWERRLGGAMTEILAYAGRLYLGAADKFFYCLDADTGEIAWDKHVGAGVRGRPAADAKHVYFTAFDNVLRALDRQHGAQRWHTGLPFRPSSGPVILGSVLVAPGPAQALTVFDAATGRRYASISFGGKLLRPPVFAETEKGPVAAAATGEGELTENWKLSLLEQATTITQVPLTVLPGQARALPDLPAAPSIPRAPLTTLPGTALPLPIVPRSTAGRQPPRLQPAVRTVSSSGRRR